MCSLTLYIARTDGIQRTSAEPVKNDIHQSFLKVCSAHSVTMKVLILVVLVAVATAKPADNSIERLARSLAEDEVMKRGVLSNVVNAVCIPVMDSVIGLANGACAFLDSADSICIQLADQYLGSFLSGLFSKPVASMCQNLAQLAVNECNKGTVQNFADIVCTKLTDLPIIG
ncbi:uncharacterized protein LOC106173567 [Lingula anatina]|uniref:Uncharacterized protein LOC106173567 n=1 Tax=Lingula anatina TaxID=7574 RepID=A0A1S3JIJ2_LINAN|nr:uncharacterized protein LOC106173567 [Lingula anatina]|eukprot:XP_013410188.1 uncharacterized protein LOC106173567 [Lingula anatina]